MSFQYDSTPMNAQSGFPLLFPEPMPTDYATSLEALAPSITAKVAEVQTPGESWIDTITRILPSILATVQQRELLQVQVERARAGLPALDVSQYTSGVSVGVDAGTRQLLMYGGIAALAVWAFSATRRG